jgi:flagellar hook-associated protein 3 FlgL
MMGALYALATSDLTIANDAGYRELARLAMNDLDQGFDELQEQIGILGVRQDTIEQTEQRHIDFLVILQNQIVNVEDVDAADAMTRLTLLQTNLESSFRLIAGTRDLSLTNYL